jgi:hypothetical protein
MYIDSNQRHKMLRTVQNLNLETCGARKQSEGERDGNVPAYCVVQSYGTGSYHEKSCKILLLLLISKVTERAVKHTVKSQSYVFRITRKYRQQNATNQI